MFPTVSQNAWPSSYPQFLQLPIELPDFMPPAPSFVPHQVFLPDPVQEMLRSRYGQPLAFAPPIAPYEPLPFLARTCVSAAPFYAYALSVSPSTSYNVLEQSYAFHHTAALGAQKIQPPSLRPEFPIDSRLIAEQASKEVAPSVNFDDAGPPPLFFCPPPLPSQKERELTAKQNKGKSANAPDWRKLMLYAERCRTIHSDAVSILFEQVRLYLCEQDKKGISPLQAIETIRLRVNRCHMKSLFRAVALYFALIGQQECLRVVLHNDCMNASLRTQALFFFVAPFLSELPLSVISDPNFDDDLARRALFFKELITEHSVDPLANFHGGVPVVANLVSKHVSELFTIIVQCVNTRRALRHALCQKKDNSHIWDLFLHLFHDKLGLIPSPEWVTYFENIHMPHADLMRVLSQKDKNGRTPVQICIKKREKLQLAGQEYLAMQWEALEQELRRVLGENAD